MTQYSAPNFDVNLDPDGFVLDLDSLYAALARLKDSRHARGMRYSLVNLLVCIVLAKLAGEDYIAGIAEWVAKRTKPLSEMLHWVKPRAAHRSTYSRILGHVIDITEFEGVVHDYFAHPAHAGESILINLDGKTLRGTIPAGQTRGVHLLAAYLPGEGWVLAQIEVGTKENEIPASARMLQALDLQGKIITGDALLAQRELSHQIVEAKGDYVWTLKDNQPQMVEDLETLFAGETTVKGFSPATHDFRPAETIEKAHGRIERRTLTASTELKGYDGNWPYAEQVFKLERHFERVADGRVMHEVVYGVTSLTAQEADAARLLEIVRGHWAIENRLHYRRDQTMREDWYHVRMGTAPQAMAVINNLVLGLLDKQDFRSVPEARRHYAANLDQALDLIIQSPC